MRLTRGCTIVNYTWVLYFIYVRWKDRHNILCWYGNSNSLRLINLKPERERGHSVSSQVPNVWSMCAVIYLEAASSGPGQAQYSAASDHDQHQPGSDQGTGHPGDGGELPGPGPCALHPPDPQGPQHSAALAQ